MYIQIGSEHVFYVLYMGKELSSLFKDSGTCSRVTRLRGVPKYHASFVLMTLCSEMSADELSFFSICPLPKSCFSHKMNVGWQGTKSAPEVTV